MHISDYYTFYQEHHQTEHKFIMVYIMIRYSLIEHCTAHLAYLVHKSGCETSIIIIIIIEHCLAFCLWAELYLWSFKKKLLWTTHVLVEWQTKIYHREILAKRLISFLSLCKINIKFIQIYKIWYIDHVTMCDWYIYIHVALCTTASE